MAIARQFNTSPVDVLQWPNPIYLDAVEDAQMCIVEQERYEEDMKARYGNGY